MELRHVGRLARVMAVATPPAFTAPGKRCRLSVPGAETAFECNLELFHCEVVRPVRRP
jgi:hypothetical protein